MTQNIWCRLFNLHKYEIIKEEPITSRYDSKIVIGINIISRCTNCGKIKVKQIATKDEYRC